MTGRALPPGLYGLDDLCPGDHWATGEREITPELVDAFAGLTHDRFALHLDDAAARKLGFPRRVAHGLLVLSVIDGLKNNAPVRLSAVASLGWDWTFRRPVLAGTRIGAGITVASLRTTSDPARGIARLAFEVRDADGTPLQRGTNALMMLRRAPPPDGRSTRPRTTAPGSSGPGGAVGPSSTRT